MISQGEKQLLSVFECIAKKKKATEGGNRKSIELQKRDDWVCRSQASLHCYGFCEISWEIDLK